MVAPHQPVVGSQCEVEPPATAKKRKKKKKHHESLVEQCKAGAGGDGGDGGGGLKDASRVRSGAGEGEIVRWAAFLSAEVMAEW